MNSFVFNGERKTRPFITGPFGDPTIIAVVSVTVQQNQVLMSTKQRMPHFSPAYKIETKLGASFYSYELSPPIKIIHFQTKKIELSSKITDQSLVQYIVLLLVVLLSSYLLFKNKMPRKKKSDGETTSKRKETENSDESAIKKPKTR